jgi:ferredoxin
MKREKASARTSSIKPCDAGRSEVKRQTPAPVDYASGIDFHTAEFNRADDLNDCSGNYRSFETLDGIATTHERHQIELRRSRNASDQSWNGSAPSQVPKFQGHNTEKVEAATPVTLISEGRTLIIDTNAERAIACGRILGDRHLSCTLLITGKASEGPSPPGPGRPRLLRVDSVSISGAFGGFAAIVASGGKVESLTHRLANAATFDLVLDLQPIPAFAGNRLPLGYYAPGPDPVALEEAIAEIPEMRGQFQKPQFVSLHRDRCFHGRSRARDCCRCLEICPVGAIQSADRKISINHYLCQGCGGCALVCPADAISIVQPSQEELLDALRNRLQHRSANEDSPLTVVISDEEPVVDDGPQESDEPGRTRTLHFKVGQIAHVRLEMVLAILAYGAEAVLVVSGPRNPFTIKKAVKRHVQMARAILHELGLGEERIQIVDASPVSTDFTTPFQRPAGLEGHFGDSPMVAASFPPGADKRVLVHLAVRHLHDQSGVRKSWLPLPMGSPFGAVTVNATACTLCMACAAACPAGALSSDEKAPRLLFRESQCHQCGLCRETCPEGAIRLVPRLLVERGDFETQTILREAEPFRCIECGVPFASPTMINRIKEKLAGHWMYANDRQVRRLRMCRTCRTRDALASQEMGSWNQ